jgi:hypothetical protein
LPRRPPRRGGLRLLLERHDGRTLGEAH